MNLSFVFFRLKSLLSLLPTNFSSHVGSANIYPNKDMSIFMSNVLIKIFLFRKKCLNTLIFGNENTMHP